MSTPENQTPETPAAPAQPVVTQAAPTNTLAIITLILALIPSFGLTQIGGIITGHISLKQLKTSGENGHALAKWGLILSYIFLGVFVLFWILSIIIPLLLLATVPMSYTY